jgi:HK97 family phage portal protein
LLVEDENRSRRVAASSRNDGEKRSVSSFREPTDLLLNALGGLPSTSGARVGEFTALTDSGVSACVTLLADMLGMLPLKLYRKTETGADVVTDHPAADIVSISPDGQRTCFEHRRLVQTGVGIGGNGYSRVVRYGGSIQAVNWMRPIDVNPRMLADGSVVYHINGDTTARTRSDVLHVSALSSNGVVGLSPITMMREDIGLALTQRDMAGRMYSNGARHSGVLISPPSIKPEDLKKTKESWQDANSGSHNAFKTPVLVGGWDYKTIQGMTLRDAEFLESRSFSVEIVARYYRVPLFLLQSTQKATTWGSGLEQMMQAFLSVSLNPWLVNWEQALGITLLTTQEIRDGLSFQFNRRALLQVALEAQAKFLRDMRDIAVYNVDDCRRYLGENALPQGMGQDYDQPFNGSGGAQAEPTDAGKPAASATQEDQQ